MKKEKLTYEECDRLVLAYRDENCQESALLLIDAFEGYIVKYFNIIRRGKLKVEDRDVREFVKLYMMNEAMRRLIHQFKRKPAVYSEINSVTLMIKNSCESYSDEELMSEIHVALLTMAKRYKSPDGKPRFHTYMLRAFHYQLRRQLEILTGGPISYIIDNNTYHNNATIPKDYTYDKYDIEFCSDNTPTFTIDEEMETINENWVLGYTTESEFGDLTVMERKILKMYYVDEMSDQQIADRLGTCRATINRRRNKVKRNLRTARESRISEGS